MTEPSPPIVRAACTCGSVTLELSGAPIVAAACYCDDCQAGGRLIAALPQAPPVVDADGGTQYLLYRKDRVQVARGTGLLSRHKLREKTITNRGRELLQHGDARRFRRRAALGFRLSLAHRR